jgi:hypothetical protein
MPAGADEELRGPNFGLKSNQAEVGIAPTPQGSLIFIGPRAPADGQGD